MLNLSKNKATLAAAEELLLHIIIDFIVPVSFVESPAKVLLAAACVAPVAVAFVIVPNKSVFVVPVTFTDKYGLI